MRGVAGKERGDFFQMCVCVCVCVVCVSLFSIFTNPFNFFVIETENCLDKTFNIFQTTRFNHTMIFFKLND